MKLSFLINLILVIILVVGIFMVINGGMNMRSKLVALVFLGVIAVYLFSSISIFSDHNTLLDGPKTAKESYTISESELKKTNGQFTISTWVFVDDWNYKYGEDKTILEKIVDTGANVPRIYFDEHKNDIKIDMSVMRDEKSNFQIEMYDTLKNTIKGRDIEILDTIEPEDLECSGGRIFDTNRNIPFNAYCDVSASSETVTVENIGLQKWINIIVSVNSRNMDTYINGKLVKTTAFNNVVNTGLLNNGDINITPNGGFGGYVSNVEYYPRFITPEKAWSIYKRGLGNSLSNFLDKYNMSLTFYEDSIEKKKYWVF